MNNDEAERAVRSAHSKAERIAYFGALIGGATGNRTIIVGGSAIEVYTSGRVASKDIDIVTARRDAIEVAESWGFVKRGRIWRHQDWQMDLDFVGPHLSGNDLKTQTLSTPYGPVDLIGLEDLLVKRLAELKHWESSREGRRELVRQISILLTEFANRLDEDYLSKIVQRDDVIDILADFREHIRPIRG